MNLAILGSSSINDINFLNQAVSPFGEIDMIITGRAEEGIEALALAYSRNHSVPIKLIYPNANKNGGSAGLKQKSAIINEADKVLIIWDGDSTGPCNDAKFSCSGKKWCRVVPFGLPQKEIAKDILEFDNKNFWLSPYWPCEIEVGGTVFPSVSNVINAAKFYRNKDLVKAFTEVTPYEAPELANTFYAEHRKDYDEAYPDKQLGIMERATRSKFTQNAYLGQKLKLTGQVRIVNSNSYGDLFWGSCNGNGYNYLGLIIEKVRKELQA